MNNKVMIAVVIGVVVLGGAYFMMNSKKSDSMMTAKPTDTMTKPVATEGEMGKPSAGVMVGGALMTAEKDIVDNAVNSKDHTTVVAAVKAAGLVETLKSAGPFTVFAPTNAAFAKLPAGTVETLVMPENKAKLTGILTYHVVPGAYRSTDIKDGMVLKTVNGQSIKFTMKDGSWWINESAMVEIADVISSNGVTHVINTVLMPK